MRVRRTELTGHEQHGAGSLSTFSGPRPNDFVRAHSLPLMISMKTRRLMGQLKKIFE
jgi:hypothetical protein